MVRRIVWAVYVAGSILSLNSTAASQSKPVNATVSQIVRNPAKYQDKTIRLRASVHRLLMMPEDILEGVALIDTEARCSFLDRWLMERGRLTDTSKRIECAEVVLHLDPADTTQETQEFIKLVEERIETNTRAEDTKEQLAVAGAVLGLQSWESASAARSPCSKSACWGCFRYEMTGVFVGKVHLYPSPARRVWKLHMKLESVSEMNKVDELGRHYDERCYQPKPRYRVEDR